MPPAPKDPRTRQRRNRTTTAAVLSAGPAQKVPLPTRFSSLRCSICPLPRYQHLRKHFEEREIDPHDYDPAPVAWRPMTEAWWETIWASPMVNEWVDADVPDLVAIAVLVDEFWTYGDAKIHAEIRMASREFGLSPLSRRQLQWEVRKLETKPAAAEPEQRRNDPRLRVLA